MCAKAVVKSTPRVPRVVGRLGSGKKIATKYDIKDERKYERAACWRLYFLTTPMGLLARSRSMRSVYLTCVVMISHHDLIQYLLLTSRSTFVPAY